ncbi:DUF3015 domain-containing protein [bacterium]|nr:DUF3015 domain-containing protein [bacterium]
MRISALLTGSLSAVALLVVTSLPLSAHAQNVGRCGWGSKLFSGQKGLVPQVLAVTTNGTSGNQTFAMTSGTSGCTQDGVVKSNWKTAAYIDANMNKFARDASRGSGEAVTSLAKLLEMNEADTEVFARSLQDNFSKLFPSESVTSQEVTGALREMLAADAQLAAYSANV